MKENRYLKLYKEKKKRWIVKLRMKGRKERGGRKDESKAEWHGISLCH